MKSLALYDRINLVGEGLTRGVTIPLPTEQVRNLLPLGLALGEQDLTPPGTHPVIFFFQVMFRAHMTIPTVLPPMTYNEHILGIPFSYVTRRLSSSLRSGPFFFMPRLHLDSFLATIGGVLWWGYSKQMANITVTERRFVVSTSGGDPLIALDFDPTGDYRPVDHYQNFKPIGRIMRQPMVSQLPVGAGPWFACSNFERGLSVGELRPLSTSVHITREFVHGLPCGSFRAEGIDRSPLGSYELRAPWRQGLIYPCSLGSAPLDV
jgi:hypothetical protein